jgi:hypothetical protein
MSSQASYFLLCKMNVAQQDYLFYPEVSYDLMHGHIIRHQLTFN